MASKYSQHAEGKIYPEQASLQWKKVPLYAITTLKKITNLTNRQLLSVYLNLGVIPFKDVSEKRTNATSDDLSKYQAVDPGDFVLNNQQAWRGSVGVSKFSGIVSPAYIVLSLSDEIEANFANYLFRNSTMANQYLICSKGVGSIQRNLYWPYLKRVLVNIPSQIEQNRIARFLDYKCAQINKFIQKKKRLIELLKEQKQVIINQAVTCGLDPNVRLKPSGVEWLGDIPEHWEIKKLKYLMRNHAEQTGNKSDDEVYIALEHVESWTGKLNLPDEEVPFESLVKKFAAGDILFGKLRPYLAKVIQTAQKGVCVGEFLVLRRIDSDLSNNFLEILLRSKRIIDIITASTFGAKMPRADWNFIGNLPIAYPSKDEQLKIAAYLKNKTEKIDKGIEALSQQVNLIQEYRTRLISDVVTGQIDVRNIEFSDIPENELIEEALEEEQEEESLELVGAGDDD